ncbi:MAG: signal peptidase II [Candidatus Magasanikbacteria bacterium]|nr:signal peptidase II [Candidatus Magasanikbacteria bacterium]
MHFKKARLVFITSGLFLLVDQFLKWQATHNWQTPHLLFPHVGWELFLNTGAAFSLPINNKPILFFTLIIISLITYLLIKELKKEQPSQPLLLAWSIILSGALSNLLDRILHSYVIDYLVLGTAIINLADILIVSGLLIYSTALLREKKNNPSSSL